MLSYVKFYLLLTLFSVSYADVDDTPDVTVLVDSVEPPKNVHIPTQIVNASLFIEEFHKKFQHKSFHQLSKSYITPDDNVASDTSLFFFFGSVGLGSDNQKSDNGSETKKNPRKLIVNCEPYNYTGSPHVEIIRDRGTDVFKSSPAITRRSLPAPCSIVIFYTPSCPFSAFAAPHFNALPRVFPSIRTVAVDSDKFPGVNAQFGVTAVPTLILFHNGKPVAKFNRSAYTLIEFVKFVSEYTGIAPNEKMFVASTDFGGPLKCVPTQQPDINLYMALTVLICCVLGVLVRTLT